MTSSKKILTMQKEFHQDIYFSKSTIPLENSRYSNFLTNLPKISEEKKTDLDKPYIIQELKIAIKSSKLNKAPGTDGFPNEFFKFFIEELKKWIFRYFTEAIAKGELSKISLEGIITCIPKQGKL